MLTLLSALQIRKSQVFGWQLDGFGVAVRMERGLVFPGLFYTDIFPLLLLKCSRKTQGLQFALQRVSVLHPISLCNALFIASLCNYSVIRLATVQGFFLFL